MQSIETSNVIVSIQITIESVQNIVWPLNKSEHNIVNSNGILSQLTNKLSKYRQNNLPNPFVQLCYKNYFYETIVRKSELNPKYKKTFNFANVEIELGRRKSLADNALISKKRVLYNSNNDLIMNVYHQSILENILIGQHCLNTDEIHKLINKKDQTIKAQLMNQNNGFVGYIVYTINVISNTDEYGFSKDNDIDFKTKLSRSISNLFMKPALNDIDKNNDLYMVKISIFSLFKLNKRLLEFCSCNEFKLYILVSYREHKMQISVDRIDDNVKINKNCYLYITKPFLESKILIVLYLKCSNKSFTRLCSYNLILSNLQKYSLDPVLCNFYSDKEENKLTSTLNEKSSLLIYYLEYIATIKLKVTIESQNDMQINKYCYLEDLDLNNHIIQSNLSYTDYTLWLDIYNITFNNNNFESNSKSIYLRIQIGNALVENYFNFDYNGTVVSINKAFDPIKLSLPPFYMAENLTLVVYIINKGEDRILGNNTEPFYLVLPIISLLNGLNKKKNMDPLLLKLESKDGFYGNTILLAAKLNQSNFKQINRPELYKVKYRNYTLYIHLYQIVNLINPTESKYPSIFVRVVFNGKKVDSEKFNCTSFVNLNLPIVLENNYLDTSLMLSSIHINVYSVRDDDIEKLFEIIIPYEYLKFNSLCTPRWFEAYTDTPSYQVRPKALVAMQLSSEKLTYNYLYLLNPLQKIKKYCAIKILGIRTIPYELLMKDEFVFLLNNLFIKINDNEREIDLSSLKEDAANFSINKKLYITVDRNQVKSDISYLTALSVDKFFLMQTFIEFLFVDKQFTASARLNVNEHIQDNKLKFLEKKMFANCANELVNYGYNSIEESNAATTMFSIKDNLIPIESTSRLGDVFNLQKFDASIKNRIVNQSSNLTEINTLDKLKSKVEKIEQNSPNLAHCSLAINYDTNQSNDKNKYAILHELEFELNSVDSINELANKYPDRLTHISVPIVAFISKSRNILFGFLLLIVAVEDTPNKALNKITVKYKDYLNNYIYEHPLVLRLYLYRAINIEKAINQDSYRQTSYWSILIRIGYLSRKQESNTESLLNNDASISKTDDFGVDENYKDNLYILNDIWLKDSLTKNNAEFNSFFQTTIKFPENSIIIIYLVRHESLNEVKSYDESTDRKVLKTQINLEERWYKTKKEVNRRLNMPAELRTLFLCDQINLGTNLIKCGKLSLKAELLTEIEATRIAPAQINKIIYVPLELRLIIYKLNNIHLSNEIKYAHLYVRCTLINLQNDFGDNQDTEVNYYTTSNEAQYNWRFVFNIPDSVDKYILNIKVYSMNLAKSSNVIAETELSLNKYIASFYKLEDHNIAYQFLNNHEEMLKPLAMLDISKGNPTVTLDCALVTKNYASRNPVGRGQEEPNVDPYLEPIKTNRQYLKGPKKLINFMFKAKDTTISTFKIVFYFVITMSILIIIKLIVSIFR